MRAPEENELRVTVSEVHVPPGSTIGVGRGTDQNGREVFFGGDHRPMLHLLDAVNDGLEPEAHVDTYQLIEPAMYEAVRGGRDGW